MENEMGIYKDERKEIERELSKVDADFQRIKRQIDEKTSEKQGTEQKI